MEIELRDWLFDSSANRRHSDIETRFVHGHVLKSGDVARSDWRLRCAQPPYDGLPAPRATIPPGIVLSRDGDAWIIEDSIDDIALPVYVGKMIYVGNWAVAPVPRDQPGRLDLDPEFLMGVSDLRHDPQTGSRVVFRNVSNSTNERSFVPALVPGLFPCGNSLPAIQPSVDDTTLRIEFVTYVSCLVFDWGYTPTHVRYKPKLAYSRNIELTVT